MKTGSDNPRDRYDWVLFDVGGTLFYELPPHYSERNQRALINTLGARQWVNDRRVTSVFRQARATVDRRFLNKAFYPHQTLVANHALVALAELGITALYDWQSLDARRNTTGCTTEEQALAAAIDQYFAAQASTVVDNVRLQRGCHEMFDRLSGHYQMAVVSNNADSYLLPLLARYRLNRWLVGAYSSDALGACKPDPTIFQLACEQLGIGEQHRRRILYVGDSYNHDVTGARGAGLDVALLSATPQIRKPEPTYTLSSLSELADVLTS